MLLDKPLGLSSNAALQKVRRALAAKKAGHVGTLDPLATGMLPICLDEATKVISDLESARKSYTFTIALGARTSTGDVEGDVIERRPVPAFEHEAVATAMAKFVGRQSQTPPMYSAIKQAGRPLYELARAGEVVERAPRTIEIEKLSCRAVHAEAIEADCVCSKGTYIRVLAEDIARALGTVGHVSRLHRNWVEPFESAHMVELAAVLADPARAQAALLPCDAALPTLPAVMLAPEHLARCRQGQAVPAQAIDGRPAPVGTRVRIYGPGGAFVGLGEMLPNGVVRPRRLLADGGPASH